MKSTIRARPIQVALLIVGPLIIVVPQFVMDGHEIVGVALDAHLDAKIIDIVEIPRRRMTDDIASFGFDE